MNNQLLAEAVAVAHDSLINATTAAYVTGKKNALLSMREFVQELADKAPECDRLVQVLEAIDVEVSK
jgi:hypothetical protein